MRFILLEKIKNYIKKYSPAERRVFFICLGLSAFFWLLKKMSDSYRTTWPVSIEVNHPPEIDLVTPIPGNITADLEGDGWDLMLASLGRSALDVQFEKQEEGILNISKYLITKELEKQLLNKKIFIDKLSTEGFSLQLDSLERKKVVLLPNYSVQPADQFRLKYPPKLTPDSAWVTGPHVLVDTINFLVTNKVVYYDLKESKQELVSFLKSEQVHIEPASIMMDIEVEAETEKTMYVPLKVVNAPVDSSSVDSLVVYPSRVNLAFVLGLSEYNLINEEDFEVVIDLDGMKKESDKTTAPILLKHIPEGIENVNISPKSARFFYIKKDTFSIDSAH